MDRRQDYSRNRGPYRDHRLDHDHDHHNGHGHGHQEEEDEAATVPQYNLRTRQVFASPVRPKPHSPSARARAPRKNQQQQQEQPSPTMLAQLLHVGRRLSNVIPKSPAAKTKTNEISVQAPTPVLARHIDKRLISPLSRNSVPNPNGQTRDDDDDDQDGDADDDEEQQDKNSPTRALPKPKPKQQPKQAPLPPPPPALSAAAASRPARRNNGELDQMTTAAFRADPLPAAAATAAAGLAHPLRPTRSQLDHSQKQTLVRKLSSLLQYAQDHASPLIILGVVVLALVAAVYFVGFRPMPYAPPGADMYPSAPSSVHGHSPALLASPVSEIRVKKSEPSTQAPQPPSTPPTAPLHPPSSQQPASPPLSSNPQPPPEPQPNQDLAHLDSLDANHTSMLSSLKARLDSNDKLRTAFATDLRTSILAEVHQAIAAQRDDPAHVSPALSRIVAKAVTDKVAPALDELRTVIDQYKRQVDELQAKVRAAEAERERARARRALAAEQQHQQATTATSVSALRDLALYTSGARIHHVLTSRTYAWPAAKSAWWPLFGGVANVNAHPPEIALLGTSAGAAPDVLAGKCWTSAGARAVVTVKLARVNHGGSGAPASAPVQVGLAHVAKEHAHDFSVAPSQVKVWAIVGDTGSAEQVKAVSDNVQVLVAMAGGGPPRVEVGAPPPLVQQPQQAQPQVQQPQVIPIDALDEISPDQLTSHAGKTGGPLAKLLLASFTYPSAHQIVRQGALVWTLASVPNNTRAALDAARMPVQLVAFEVVKNHGHTDRSCVYRVGVFAEVPSEYPGARDKVHV